MIDVIIPAYNAHKTICETLFSIVMQSVRDKLNVYIVNDCSDTDYKKEVKKFSKVLNIKEVKTKKNSGPGVARQLGIDSSYSPYIVFIDADDVFYNYMSIETLYNSITSRDCDIVSGTFIEEVDDIVYAHSNDEIWMHGKIYRRKFLEDNNIRFNDTYANEDAGFNNLAFFCTKLNTIDDVIYVWRCNKNSMTRSSEYNFWGIEGYTYNICWAIKCGEERNANVYKMAKLLYETMLEVYYRYVFFRKKESTVDDILKWSVDLKKYYLKYADKLSPAVKEQCPLLIFENLYKTIGSSEVVLDNDLSFNKFLDMID